MGEYIVKNITKSRGLPIPVGANRIMRGRSCRVPRSTVLRNLSHLKRLVKIGSLTVVYKGDDGKQYAVESRTFRPVGFRTGVEPKKVEEPQVEEPQVEEAQVEEAQVEETEASETPSLEEIDDAKKSQLQAWVEEYGVDVDDKALKDDLKSALMEHFYPLDKEA